jgi:hypothetical protein
VTTAKVCIDIAAAAHFVCAPAIIYRVERLSCLSGRDEAVTATFSGTLLAKSCSLMAVFKLADEHPLTKAGFRRFYLVETAERGLRLGDVMSSSPSVASSIPGWRVDATE